MKHLNFLSKTRWLLVPLMLLTLSIGQMWGDPATSNFTNNSLGVGTGEPTWNTTVNATGFESSSYARGVTWGSGKDPVLTSSSITGTITKVSIVASTNAGASKVSLSVSVGGTAFSPASQYVSSGTASCNQSYEFTGSATGTVSVSLTNTVSDKTAWIKSITITYIAADPATIYLNAEGGTCQYNSRTEESAGAGITLPSASPSSSCASQNWTFAGWAKTAITETTTEPTLYTGSYTPVDGETLHAVYKKTESSGGSSNGSKTFTFSSIASANNWENGEPYTEVVIDPVTIEALGGGNNGKWYTSSGGSWRAYSGGTISISVENGSVTSVTSSPTCSFTVSNGTASFSPSARTDFTAITVNYTVSGASVTTYNSNPNCCTPLGSINGSVNVTNSTPTGMELNWNNVTTGVSSWTVKYKTHDANEWQTYIDAKTTSDASITVYSDGGTNNKCKCTIPTSCGTLYDFLIIANPVNGYCDNQEELNNNNQGYNSGKYAITKSGNPAGTVTGGTFITKIGQNTVTEACGDATITLAATPTTGYSFTSWSVTKTNGGAAVSVASNQFTMPAEAVTVNATFSKQHHNVVFHKNDGGEDETDTQDFTYGEAQNLKTISSIGWTRTNFNFGGWMTVSNGSSADKLDGASYTLNAVSDVDLYALWVADNTRTISYSGETHIASYSSKPTTVDIENDDEFSVAFTLDDHYTLSSVAVSMGGEALAANLISFDQSSLTVTAPAGGFTDNISVAFTIVATNYTVNWYVNGSKVHDQTDVFNTDYDEVPSDFTSFTDCSDLTFLGWKEGAIDGGSTTSAPSLATIGTKISGNKNYHAVFAEGTPGGTNKLFEETFAESTGTAGWSGNAANGTIAYDNTGWSATNPYGNGGSAKFGKSGEAGSATTPSISLTGNATLTFKSGAWISDTESTTLNLSATGADLSESSVEITKGEWNNYTVDIEDAAGSITITFTGGAASKGRFFLDDVVVSQTSSPVWTKWYTTCPHVARVTLSAPSVSNGSISFEQSGSAVTNVRTDGGEDVEVDVVPDPATGYELTGVALSGTAASHASYDAGVITIDADAEGALTATATFSQKNYSIAVETNPENIGATLGGATSTAKYGVEQTISTDEPTGYLFGGWYIYDAEDTEKEDDIYEEIFTGVYEDEYLEQEASFLMPDKNLVAVAYFDKIYSVSEFDALSKTDGDKYVIEGLICNVESYSNSKYITYHISDNGVNSGTTLKIYKGLGLNDASFSAATDLNVGERVRVYGAWDNSHTDIAQDSKLYYHQTLSVASVAIGGSAEKTAYSPSDNTFSFAGLTATATYNTGYVKDVTAEATWTANSANPYTVAAGGDVTVRATFGGQYDEETVVVTYTSKTVKSIYLEYESTYTFKGYDLPKPKVYAKYVESIADDEITDLVEAASGYDTESAYNKNTPGSYTINVAYETFNAEYTVQVRKIFDNEDAPHNVADATALIVASAYQAKESSTDYMWVRGIVSSQTQYNSSYYISDNGTTTGQLYVYSGKYFNNESFTADTKLPVGDEVIVKATIVNYQGNTPELTGSQVTYQLRDPAFAFADITADDEFEAGVSADMTVVPTSNEGDADFTLSSGNPDAVTIVAGKLHAVAEGDAIITASRAATDNTGSINYKAKNATFNVHVVPEQTKYAISFDSNDADGGAAPTPIAGKAEGANVTLPDNSWTKTGYNFDGWKVTYVDGDEVVHEVTVTANAFIMPAYNVTIQAQWAEIPVWAYTYTSNVDITGAKVKFYGEETLYDAVKAGTDKVVGSTTITVPAQATKLHFHAYGWKGETVGLTVTAPTGVTVSPATEISINSNDGMTSNSPFTMAEGSDPMNDAYYVVSLSGNDDEIEMTISATSGKRFVLFGVNQEGGIVPVLDHIAVSGELTYKDYELGDNLNTAGLTVTAYYTLAGVAHHSEDVTSSVAWSYDPLIGDQTSVDVTATYEGKTNTLACEINAVVVPEPEIILSVSELAFSGKQYSPVADKTFDVQLKNVGAATIALSGDDASKFSIDETGLTANGTITVSANTDVAGTFIATITVSDNAHDATSQTVALTLTVESDEAPAWDAEWVEAEELYDGMPILITGMKESATYAMGAQGSNNRAAVLASIENGVLTPGAGTKQFTLEKQSNGTYAIKTTDGKYLYAASSNSNWLRTQENNDDNGKWTLTVTSAEATGSYTHKKMQFNGSSLIFACYTTNTTTQADIKLYTPKTYKRTISGNIGTICLPNRVEEGDYFGATFYRVMYKKGDPDAPNYVQLEEVGALEAGRPYIFVPDDRENTSVLRAVYRDKEAVANSAVNDTENHGLYGTFTQVVKDGTNEIIYILNNNTIRRCGTNCTVGANKAYIMMEEVPAEQNAPVPAPGRRQMSLLNGDARPVATGIEDVQSDVQCTKIFYDGQIYIIRGDKMYDVTGKLVK